jgi:hypothetical protein
MAEAVAVNEKVKADKPDKGSQAAKLMATMTETDGQVTVGGPVVEEEVVVDKPPVEQPDKDKAAVVEASVVEDKDKKPLPGEEEDALSTVEKEDVVELPEELKTAPIKEQLHYKHTKHLEKEVPKLREEIARLKGRIEATPAHVVTERDIQVTEQPPVSVVTDEALKIKLKALDDAYNASDGKIEWIDYMTDRAAVVAEHRAARNIHADITASKTTGQRTARANALNEAINRRMPTLPGLNEAFEALRSDKVAGNDPILLSAIESHLNDGGMDIMHYLGHHPAYRAQVMALPADEKGAELVRLRLALTKPKKAPITPINKPSTTLQNSQIVDKTAEDADDAGVMSEINKIRGRR